MIKFKNQTSNNTISSDIIKDLIDTLPATKSTIFKKKDFNIRDLRIGTIIRIHLHNDSRGDKGYVTTEVVALFNSMGQDIYNCNNDFAMVYEGVVWTADCSQIDKIISY